MLHEVNEAKKFLIGKFGSTENVEDGDYAIPVETSKGKAFMKVTITNKDAMSGFNLFKDEELTESWYE